MLEKIKRDGWLWIQEKQGLIFILLKEVDRDKIYSYTVCPLLSKENN